MGRKIPHIPSWHHRPRCCLRLLNMQMLELGTHWGQGMVFRLDEIPSRFENLSQRGSMVSGRPWRGYCRLCVAREIQWERWCNACPNVKEKWGRYEEIRKQAKEIIWKVLVLGNVSKREKNYAWCLKQILKENCIIKQSIFIIIIIISLCPSVRPSINKK